MICLNLILLMSFGSVLNNLNLEEKKQTRNLEKLSKKLINAKAAVTFNQICLDNNLLPNYSNIRLHNEALQHKSFTTDFRSSLVRNELNEKKKEVLRLQQQLSGEETFLLSLEQSVRDEIKLSLSEQLSLYKKNVEARIQKKLCSIYGGWVPLPVPQDGYVNLSTAILTDDQKELLNLGLNFSYSPSFSKHDKEVELELLYQDICKLKSQNKIDVNPDLQLQLQAESTKNRSRLSRPSLPLRLKQAAKQLRENDDIVIRRADKAKIFVILNKDDYIDKVQTILGDKTKFKKITRNPVDELKKQANNLIDASNKKTVGKLERIVGEFQPGYFYGNPKTHKPENPLRPIISQIPLPTYQLAKKLNNLLVPYIPTTYSLKSTSDLIDIIKCRKREGLLASLDVSSLFTNVPIERTIEILAKYAYHHSTLDAPEIPEHILCAMLRLCTTKAPFRCPQGNMYLQTDGIAMGSPLGVLFAQAFMASVEEEVLSNFEPQVSLYCRFIDDILLDVKDTAVLHQLRQQLQTTSGLTFTVEESVDHKICFLDVTIDASDSSYVTEVHRKKTDAGKCLHGKSECPQRYKESVIRAYVHRALKNCSSWSLVDQELKRVKQMLVNNCFSLSLIDSITKHTLDKYMKAGHSMPTAETTAETTEETTDTTPKTTDTTSETTTETTDNTGTQHKLFYKNTMSPGYKADEKALKTIIHRNCKPRHPNDTISLNIYYKSPKTASLIMKNNMTQDKTPTKQTNVIYYYKCNIGDCALQPNSAYIGKTTTTLSRRLTMHLQSGGPLTHTDKFHDEPLTRKTLVNNTTILAKENNPRRLGVLETILIRQKQPSINLQTHARGILTLYEGYRL